MKRLLTFVAPMLAVSLLSACGASNPKANVQPQAQQPVVSPEPKPPVEVVDPLKIVKPTVPTAKEVLRSVVSDTAGKPVQLVFECPVPGDGVNVNLEFLKDKPFSEDQVNGSFNFGMAYIKGGKSLQEEGVVVNPSTLFVIAADDSKKEGFVRSFSRFSQFNLTVNGVNYLFNLKNVFNDLKKQGCFQK